MSDIFASICALVKSHSGICVSGAHVEFMNSYLRRRTGEMGISLEKYFEIVRSDEHEFRQLINESTINETYFFREEKQFAVLRDIILPSIADKQITIWSAACATGEEAVSLALLCRQINVRSRIIATDIDSCVLSSFRKGEFLSGSLRSDGSSFSDLLEQSLVREGYIIRAQPELIASITIGEYNLLTGGDLGGVLSDSSVSVIFLRNVCIYFDVETRKKIFQRIGKKLLPGGFIFFSMSEIASINPEDFGTGFEKKHEGSVYFIRKKCGSDPVSAADDKSQLKHSSSAQDKKQQIDKISAKYDAKAKSDKTAAKSDKTAAKSDTTSTKSDKTAAKSDTTSTKSNSPANDLLKSPQAHTSAEKKQKAEAVSDFCLIVYEKITAEIDKGNISKAHIIADEFNGGVSEKHFSSYFKGIAYKSANELTNALACFERAAMLCPSFWPAHVECANMYAHNDPAKARKSFIKSAELIEEYMKNKQNRYDFLLDSFSAGYFYSLCTAYIEKGAADGNR